MKVHEYPLLMPNGKPCIASIVYDRLGGMRNPWTTYFEGLPRYFVWHTKQDAMEHLLLNLTEALRDEPEIRP